MLKQDFTDLLNTLSSLNIEVLISGPLPPVRRGAERFSRLLALKTWLSNACTQHSVHLIENLNFFGTADIFFRADEICLNKLWVKLYTSNLLYSLRLPSAPSVKDKRQEESKQRQDMTQQTRNLKREPPQPPPEESLKHEGHHRQKRESPPHMPTTTCEDSLSSSPRTPSSSPTSFVTLSVSSPLLEFTD